MPFIVISFFAGVLTALAPCVLPIIPVVIGGSISEGDNKKPYVVVLALLVSIVIFTLLLKGSTLLINIPDAFWRYTSGILIVFFGLTLLLPLLWEKISAPFHFYEKSQRALGGAYKKGGFGGAVLIGIALGPVFTSCSPVYLFILSTVLPKNFAEGLLYIISYALGLCLVLLTVGLLGQRIITKFNWAANPNGWFKRSVGILLIIAGLLIVSGYDRKIQQYVIDKGILDITRIEQKFLQ